MRHLLRHERTQGLTRASTQEDRRDRICNSEGFGCLITQDGCRPGVYDRDEGAAVNILMRGVYAICSVRAIIPGYDWWP